MYIRSGQSPKVPYHESGRQEAALRIEQQKSVSVIWEGKEKWGYRGTNKNRKPFPFEIPPGWSNLKGGVTTQLISLGFLSALLPSQENPCRHTCVQTQAFHSYPTPRDMLESYMGLALEVR